MSKPALAVAGWTPEEAARYELAVLHGLAADKKAQRVYLQKVRIVEAVRARARQQQVQLRGANTKSLDKAAAGAGGRPEGAGRPTDVAAHRARRRKSEAQRLKSFKKLQHKHLQRRCEAAATKAGGSSPRVLARVLACCGRFLELLHSEGAERMARLRQAEAGAEATLDGGGLEAMRGALAAVAATPSPMEAAPSPSWAGMALPPLAPGEAFRIKRPGLLAYRQAREYTQAAPGVFVFGGTSAAAGAVSSGEDKTGQEMARVARAGVPEATYASKCRPRDSR